MSSTGPATPTAEQLANLARTRAEKVVSLLVPPASPEEVRITLRNVAKLATEQLEIDGMRSADARALLAPVQTLLTQHDLWEGPTTSMSIYLEPSATTLAPGPLGGEPLAVVDHKFHIKHLLGALPAPRYALLVLSRGTSHLFRGAGDELVEVERAGLPAAMDDVLRYDDREPQLQSHGSSRRGVGGVVAAFHGQGGKRDQGEDLARYLRFVAAAVEKVLDGEPLVLAATDDLAAAFRRISGYSALADDHISGASEKSSTADLARAGAAIVTEGAATRRAEVVARIADSAGTRRAALDLGEVVAAAHDGRVEALVVSQGVTWGRYEPDSRRAFESPDPGTGVDLLNLAAIETWTRGGDVLLTHDDEIPGRGPIAALLRY